MEPFFIYSFSFFSPSLSEKVIVLDLSLFFVFLSLFLEFRTFSNVPSYLPSLCWKHIRFHILPFLYLLHLKISQAWKIVIHAKLGLRSVILLFPFLIYHSTSDKFLPSLVTCLPTSLGLLSREFTLLARILSTISPSGFTSLWLFVLFLFPSSPVLLIISPGFGRQTREIQELP